MKEVYIRSEHPGSHENSYEELSDEYENKIERFERFRKKDRTRRRKNNRNKFLSPSDRQSEDDYL